jgi:hypothetical protein
MATCRDMDTLSAQIDALHSALQAAQHEPAERREHILQAVARGVAELRSVHAASRDRPRLRVLDGGSNVSATAGVVHVPRRRRVVAALFMAAAAAVAIDAILNDARAGRG